MREDMEKAFPPVLSDFNFVVVAGDGPVEKCRARGQQAAASGAFSQAVLWDQFVLQAVFHVLVHPHTRRTVQIIEHPGTQLIHVAVIVPQDALHCQRITGAGFSKYRQRQKHPAVKCGLLPAYYDGSNIFSY